jgi:predicted dehydrogenase
MSISLPLRVGVIGCGAALEQLYVHPFRRLSGRGWIKIVALADPSERRREWARATFPGAQIEAAAEGVWTSAGVQLTVITSPPPWHAAHAAIAFKHGSHVLSEKPIADTVVAGTAMVEQAKAAGFSLAIGMTRRFYPCLAEARKWLQEGRLGKLKRYSYREGGVYAWPVISDAPFRRETAGGGVLLDKGIHVLDFLYWLFGPAEVIESHDDALKKGVEGNSIVVLRHAACEGRTQLSWDQDLNNGFEIEGERGSLMMPIGPLHDLYFRKPGQAWEPVPVEALWPADLAATPQKRGRARIYYECFDYQLIQILRAIALGESLPVSGQEGLEVLRLIESAYQNAQPMEQPWLSPAEQEFARKNHWRV